MKSSGVRTQITTILTRFFVCVLGVGAIVWATMLLPTFWQEASPKSVASKLLDGETFKLQSLVNEAHQAEKLTRSYHCDPVALHSLFVLRFFIFNLSIESSSRELADSMYAPPLYDAAVKSLSCTPADSFVWLTLFWLDAGKRGIDDRNTSYLRLSYSLGANEGWISLWRVRLAFLVFEALPPDLASDAINEFINLVKVGNIYWQMAGIFEQISPTVQGRIVDGLKSVSLPTRVAFARKLRIRGVDIEIPGVEKPEPRPWR